MKINKNIGLPYSNLYNKSNSLKMCSYLLVFLMHVIIEIML